MAFIRGAQLGFLGDSRIQLFGRFEIGVATLTIVGVVAVIALAGAWIWDDKRAARLEAADVAPPDEIDPFAGGYPVPPLPGQRLREPGSRPGTLIESAPGSREPVLSGSSSTGSSSTGGGTTVVKEETHG